MSKDIKIETILRALQEFIFETRKELLSRKIDTDTAVEKVRSETLLKLSELEHALRPFTEDADLEDPSEQSKREAETD